MTTLPLIWGLEGQVRGVNAQRVDVGEIAGMMRDKEADLALMPVSKFLEDPNLVVVGSGAISMIGPSNLFCLYSRVLPGEIKRVLVDQNDFGAGKLAEFLLPRQTAIRPQFDQSDQPLNPKTYPFLGDDGYDAYLVTGEHCFFVRRDAFVWSWDLNKGWYETAKLPFVVHCWAAQKGSDLGTIPDELQGLATTNRKKIKEYAARESERLGIPEKMMKMFYERALITRMDPMVITGLRRYARELWQNKLLRMPHSPTLYGATTRTGSRRVT